MAMDRASPHYQSCPDSRYDERTTQDLQQAYQTGKGRHGQDTIRTTPASSRVGTYDHAQGNSGPESSFTGTGGLFRRISDYVCPRTTQEIDERDGDRSKEIDWLNDRVNHLERVSRRQKGLIGRLSKIEEDAEADRDFIRQQESKYRCLHQRNERLIRTLSKRQSRIQQLLTEVDHLRQENRASVRLIKDLQTQNETSQKSFDQCFASLQEVSAERETKGIELQQLRAERQSDLIKIRTVQESAFAQAEEGPWAPEDDVEVRRRFASLARSIQKWSRKYVAPSLESFLTASQSKVSPFTKDLGYFMPPTVQDGAVIDLTAFNIQSKAATMLLQAWVSTTAYNRVFGSPFFFVGFRDRLKLRWDSIHDACQVPDTKAALENLLHDISSYDRHRGNTWRAELLRLYQPSSRDEQTQDERVAVEVMESLTVAAISEACNAIADLFVEDAAVFLNNESLNAARQGLREILHQAGILSYRLCTRKDDVQIRTLQDLDQPLFFSTRNDMQHHTLHEALLDANPTALDGKSIVLMLSPAVVVYSKNNDSQNYSTRVWKKATMFMGASKDAQPTSRAPMHTPASNANQIVNVSTALGHPSCDRLSGSTANTSARSLALAPLADHEVVKEEIDSNSTVFIKAEPMDLR